ncbi:MAG: BolA family protein [Maricaulaceae bacterium]
MGSVAQSIEQTLRTAFNPETLEVIDQSHLHRGHAGARPEGESHFEVRMRASAFDGLSRVARHRAVNDALADLLAEQVHALSLKLEGTG